MSKQTPIRCLGGVHTLKLRIEFPRKRTTGRFPALSLGRTRINEVWSAAALSICVLSLAFTIYWGVVKRVVKLCWVRSYSFSCVLGQDFEVYGLADMEKWRVIFQIMIFLWFVKSLKWLCDHIPANIATFSASTPIPDVSTHDAVFSAKLKKCLTNTVLPAPMFFCYEIDRYMSTNQRLELHMTNTPIGSFLSSCQQRLSSTFLWHSFSIFWE